MKYFVLVKFNRASKGYYFGTDIEDLKENDPVIVDNAVGVEVAFVAKDPKPIEEYKSELELKPILRRASKDDMLLYNHNEKKAIASAKIAQEEIDKLNLNMSVIGASYTLDATKITITYVADERVDFRDLLRVLASKLKCRIELRQIGARDRAKNVGGLGICGLPICCSNFLNEFDGISINKAKNQMLSLNVSKLTGQCGKLICCLNYEDQIYSVEKEKFPRLGTELRFEDKDYKITSYNIISRKIRLDSDEDIVFLSLDEVKKLLNEKR